MKKIQHLAEMMMDEVCGAKEYAEMYVEYKAMGNSQYANKYKEMANDELKHANYIHDITVATIKEVSTVFTPTSEMEEKWEKDHKAFVEKFAWVKQMLAM